MFGHFLLVYSFGIHNFPEEHLMCSSALPWLVIITVRFNPFPVGWLFLLVLTRREREKRLEEQEWEMIHELSMVGQTKTRMFGTCEKLMSGVFSFLNFWGVSFFWVFKVRALWAQPDAFTNHTTIFPDSPSFFWDHQLHGLSIQAKTPCYLTTLFFA